MIRFSRAEIAAIEDAESSAEAVILYREAFGLGLRNDGSIRSRWRRIRDERTTGGSS